MIYIIIHLFSKLCALVGFGVIPFVANGLIACDKGVITIILAFVICSICECGRRPE